MNAFIRSAFFCFTLLAITAIGTSCNQNRCSIVSCMNGGACSNGICTCPTGYEGANCQTISRTAFIGNWSTRETGTISDAAQYTVSIAPATSNLSTITVTNLMNYFTAGVAAVVSTDSLLIPYQVLQSKSVQGTGYLVQAGGTKSIIINYTYTDNTTNASINVQDTLKQ